jgi:hypothetical protein
LPTSQVFGSSGLLGGGGRHLVSLDQDVPADPLHEMAGLLQLLGAPGANPAVMMEGLAADGALQPQMEALLAIGMAAFGGMAPGPNGGPPQMGIVLFEVHPSSRSVHSGGVQRRKSCES